MKLKNLLANKIFKFIIRVLITIIIIFLLVQNIGFKNIINSVSQLDTIYVISAWLVGITIHILEAFQMRWLMGEVNMEVSTSRVFLAGALSNLYGLILPGDLVSGVAKWANLSSATRKKSGVLNSMVYLKLSQLLPWFFSGLIAFAIHNPSDGFVLPVILGIFSLLIFLFSFFIYHPRTGPKINGYLFKTIKPLIPQRLEQKINSIFTSLDYFYELNWLVHIKILLFSFMLIIVSFIGFYFSTKAVGIDLPFSVLVWAKSIITIIRQLPISISGLGVRESLLVVVFSPFEIPNSSSFLVGILMFSNSVIYAIIGAVYQIFLSLGLAKWSAVKQNQDT